MIACGDLLSGGASGKKDENIGHKYWDSDNEDVDAELANNNKNVQQQQQLTTAAAINAPIGATNGASPASRTQKLTDQKQTNGAQQQPTTIGAPLKNGKQESGSVDLVASIQAINEKLNAVIGQRNMYAIGNSVSLVPTDNAGQKTVILTLSHTASPLELENQRAAQKGHLPALICSHENIGAEFELPKGVTMAGVTKMTIISVQNGAPYSIGLLAPSHLKTSQRRVKDITNAGSFLVEVAGDSTVSTQIPLYDCKPSAFKQNLLQSYPGVTTKSVGEGFKESLHEGMLWVPLTHPVMVSIKSRIKQTKAEEEAKGLVYTGPTIESMKHKDHGYHVPKNMVTYAVNDMVLALAASSDTLDVKNDIYLNYARSNLSGKKLSANDAVWTDPLELGTKYVDKQYQVRAKVLVEYTDPDFKPQNEKGASE